MLISWPSLRKRNTRCRLVFSGLEDCPQMSIVIWYLALLNSNWSFSRLYSPWQYCFRTKREKWTLVCPYIIFFQGNFISLMEELNRYKFFIKALWKCGEQQYNYKLLLLSFRQFHVLFISNDFLVTWFFECT